MESYYSSKLIDHVRECACNFDIDIRNKESIHSSHLKTRGIYVNNLIMDELTEFIPLGKNELTQENLEALKGNVILYQYPDSSSWSTVYHTRFVEIIDITSVSENNVTGVQYYFIVKPFENILAKNAFYTESLNLLIYRHDCYKIWMPKKMYLEKILKFPMQKIKEDIGYMEYVYNPDTITKNNLGENLFDSPLYNKFVDFIDTIKS